jgi:hypothetical protein
MYVRLFELMYTDMYTYVYTYTYNLYMYVSKMTTRIHTCMYTYIHTCMYTYMYVYIHAWIQCNPSLQCINKHVSVCKQHTHVSNGYNNDTYLGLAREARIGPAQNSVTVSRNDAPALEHLPALLSDRLGGDLLYIHACMCVREREITQTARTRINCFWQT